jgi:hypothetical protein
MINEKQVRDRLVERGQALLNAPKEPMIPFTRVPEADTLLNDLEHHPHAFVLACVMDRQMKAEKAWIIPHRISQRLGSFSMEALRALTQSDVARLMSEPEPLHRFTPKMSGFFHSTVQRINSNYSGDAARIWAGKPSSAEVVYRFLGLRALAPKLEVWQRTFWRATSRSLLRTVSRLTFQRMCMSVESFPVSAFVPLMLPSNR